MLLLNDIKRKLLACFYPLQVMCNTSFSVQCDQLICFILVFIHLIAYQCHLSVYLDFFSKMKEIMNVNIECITLSFEK